jgi:hypothetical protein
VIAERPWHPWGKKSGQPTSILLNIYNQKESRRLGVATPVKSHDPTLHCSISNNGPVFKSETRQGNSSEKGHCYLLGQVYILISPLVLFRGIVDYYILNKQ